MKWSKSIKYHKYIASILGPSAAEGPSIIFLQKKC